MSIIEDVERRLHKEVDTTYRKFNANIVNTSMPLLGVRMPILRDIAKQIIRNGQWRDFLDNQSSELYEMAMIRGFVIAGVAKKEGFEWLEEQLNSFVPTIENWAVCDCFCGELKVAKKYRDELMPIIERNIDSGGEFEVRWGVIMLMSYYLDEQFVDFTLAKLQTIDTSQYYVMMGVAWALSVGYIKHTEKVERLIVEQKFSKTTHNKAISKICDSFRVHNDAKERIKSLRIK